MISYNASKKTNGIPKWTLENTVGEKISLRTEENLDTQLL